MKTVKNAHYPLSQGKQKMKNRHFFLNLTNISPPILALGGMFLLVIGFKFFIEQIIYPQAYDAVAYLHYAKIMNAGGIEAMTDPLRTFAYPWILSLIIKASQAINLPEKFLIFLVQISFYYLATLFVSSVASEYSKKLPIIIYLALCVNIFVIPYTGITLTDSLYTSLSIVLFGMWMKINFFHETKQIYPEKFIFLCVLLLSLAMTIRPAAIWLAVPTCYCFIECFGNERLLFAMLY